VTDIEQLTKLYLSVAFTGQTQMNYQILGIRKGHVPLLNIQNTQVFENRLYTIQHETKHLTSV